MCLQILSPRAILAVLNLPAEEKGNAEGERLPVLLLPEIPALNSTELLVVPSGALHNRDQKLVLVVDQANIKVREIRAICVEVFAIQSDKSP